MDAEGLVGDDEHGREALLPRVHALHAEREREREGERERKRERERERERDR